MRAGKLLLIAAVAIPAAAAALVLVSQIRGDATATTDVLPDLEQVPPYDLSGRTGGTAANRSFFFGFASAAGNVGVGPLLVLGTRASVEQPKMKLVQQIRRSDGSIRTKPTNAALSYVSSLTHSHWHLLGFMRYELRSEDGNRVLHDKKTGFCLGDRYRVEPPIAGAARFGRYTEECGKNNRKLLRVQEGISVGFGDDYKPHLEGQEFEITTLPPGRYVLVHRVNPTRAAAREQLRQQRRVGRLRPDLAARSEPAAASRRRRPLPWHRYLPLGLSLLGRVGRAGGRYVVADSDQLAARAEERERSHREGPQSSIGRPEDRRHRRQAFAP